MFTLYAKNSTTTAINPEAKTTTKLMAYNDGQGVGIWLDGKVVVVPVQEFYEKLKLMFFVQD